MKNKKILLLLIVISVILCSCQKGDLNLDGKVTRSDCETTFKIAVAKIVPNVYQRWAGDVNGDGRINSADVALISRMAK